MASIKTVILTYRGEDNQDQFVTDIPDFLQKRTGRLSSARQIKRASMLAVPAGKEVTDEEYVNWLLDLHRKGVNINQIHPSDETTAISGKETINIQNFNHAKFRAIAKIPDINKELTNTAVETHKTYYLAKQTQDRAVSYEKSAIETTQKAKNIAEKAQAALIAAMRAITPREQDEVKQELWKKTVTLLHAVKNTEIAELTTDALREHDKLYDDMPSSDKYTKSSSNTNTRSKISQSVTKNTEDQSNSTSVAHPAEISTKATSLTKDAVSKERKAREEQDNNLDNALSS